MVAGAVNVGWANGGTRAFESAARMHASAGLPAAPPETVTLWTLPSDLKVTRRVRDGVVRAEAARARRQGRAERPLDGALRRLERDAARGGSLGRVGRGAWRRRSGSR